ncbi:MULTISPECIES: ABC transporter substrate-binding protein [Alphaproteobacteria]
MHFVRNGTIAALLTLGLSVNLAKAQTPGVTGEKIVFGQSAAFEGPAGALTAANKSGGINGRMLEIVKYDDGYEPDRAIANTNKLIDQDKVFSVIGAVGTPTSKATQPITTEAKVPFVGPFTGAGFLRDPKNSNVISVRAT